MVDDRLGSKGSETVSDTNNDASNKDKTGGCVSNMFFTDFCRKEGYEVEPRSLVYKDSHDLTSIIFHVQETVVIFLNHSLLLHNKTSTKHSRKQQNNQDLDHCSLDDLRIP